MISFIQLFDDHALDAVWTLLMAGLEGGLLLAEQAGSFYIDSTHISFIFGSIFMDECRLLPCVYIYVLY